MQKILGGALMAALFLSVAACSGSQSGGSGALPNAVSANARSGGMQALAPKTPYAQKATYTTSTSLQIQTWASANAAPKHVDSSDTGSVVVALSVNQANDKFTEDTDTTMKSGSKESFDLNGQFVTTGSKTTQEFGSDTYQGTTTLPGPGSRFSGTDSWPNSETGAVFPLTPGSTWSSTGLDNYTFDNIQYTGSNSGTPSGDENQGQYAQQASGFYKGSDTWTHSASGATEYAESSDASPAKLSYTLNVPGYAPEDWSYAAPSNGQIAVTVSGNGKPAYPRGTFVVPDWYPGARALPANLIVDNEVVLKNKVDAPAACHIIGKATAVQETWSILDPIAGSFSSGTNMYYNWASATGFPGCVSETYTDSLIANGSWYVSWMTGKAYYQEKGTLIDVLSSITGKAVTNVAPAVMSWFGTPIVVRERIAQSHLQSLRKQHRATLSQ